VLIGSSIYRHSLDWNNLGSAIKVVQFSQQEATDYQKDIFLAVQGNKKPLEMLLDKFQREKRYGFLPALPSNYGNRSDIFWIEGRPLLSTPSKKF
jgi:hypothetical protein